jgi:hypothetical protein
MGRESETPKLCGGTRPSLEIERAYARACHRQLNAVGGTVSTRNGIRCRCVKWEEGQPCCREVDSEGARINKLILDSGVFALTNANGDHLYFYPRRGLRPFLADYLGAQDSRRLKILRDYLLKL